MFCEIKNGFAFKSTEFQKSGIPLLRISNFNNGPVFFDAKTVYLDESLLKSKRTFIVQKGDVLIALSGATTGKFGLYTEDKPSLLNQRIGLLKSGSSKNLDDKYFYHFLSVLQKKILQKAGGAAQPNISTKAIGELKIPLPPLPEQRRIAALLDQADQLRRLHREQLAEYDLLAQSVFLEMFGDPVLNEKGWEIKKLSDVCSKITDGTHHSPPLMEIGFPYVTAKHVKKYGLDFKSSPTYISPDEHDKIFKRCAPEKGDILYIKDGATTGIAAINTFRSPISLLSSLALLKPNYNVISNLFLCYWLNDERVKKKLVRENMSGAAIKRYTLRKIKNFKIQLPPIEIQLQFSEIIQNIEQQKAYLQEAQQEAEDLFQALLQEVFQEA